VQKSAGKIQALIFWDQDETILINYPPKGQSINKEYYSSLLVQMKDILREKRPRNFTKLFLLLPENAPLTGHSQPRGI
jgi:hypothetical protein